MSRIRFQAKLNGRKILEGNWFRAMFTLLLILLLLLGLTALETGYRAAFGVPQLLPDGSMNLSPASLIITGAYTLLCILFLPPLLMGQAEWFWNLSRGQRPKVGDVFGWFGSLRLYLKSVWLMVNLGFRCLLWAVPILALPAAALIAGDYYYDPRDAASLANIPAMLLLFIGLMLLLGALFLLLFIYSRYFPAVFLLAEDSGRRVTGVIRDSRRYTKGYRWEITKFVLSFLLWIITCYFVLPAFFVVPYLFASSSVLARHIIFTRRAQEREQGQEKEKEKAQV